MRFTRHLLAILALASFTFAFAEDTEKGAKHHEAPAAESKEMKDCGQCCGQCKGSAKGAKRTPPPKVRDTGPAIPDYMS